MGLSRQDARRYAEMARYARPSQVLGRARRLVPLRVLAAGLAEEPPPGWRPVATGLAVDPAPQSGPQPPPDADGVFRAIGHARAFAPEACFWADDADGLLFLFHLHGFERLAEYAAGPRSPDGDAFWSAALGSWLDECGAPAGPAWHPYPLSARLRTWCAALSAGGWPESLAARMRTSAWLQARLLRRSVEHDIGGNHVLHNAVALTMAGTCLDAPALATAGAQLLERQLRRQVLPDGGHEERSPSYQRTIAAQVADAIACLERAGLAVPAGVRTTHAAMTAWLRALAGPDGRLPLLNDAWEGPPLEDPDRATLVDLPSTGYLVLRHGDDQAVLDLAPLAPDHLPPHAHADALSFVLWRDGRPLVVDPGSFTYAGPDRDRFRGTAAHSTVSVDGRDQCDFWGPFRAARLPRTRRLALQHRADAVIVTAEHDGYRRLPDPVTHRRVFCWFPGDGVVVVDVLDARAAHRVHSALPLAPGAAADGVGAIDGAPVDRREGRHGAFLGTAFDSEVLVQDRTVQPGEPFGWQLLRTRASVRRSADGGVVIERDSRERVVVPPPVRARAGVD